MLRSKLKLSYLGSKQVTCKDVSSSPKSYSFNTFCIKYQSESPDSYVLEYSFLFLFIYLISFTFRPHFAFLFSSQPLPSNLTPQSTTPPFPFRKGQACVDINQPCYIKLQLDYAPSFLQRMDKAIQQEERVLKSDNRSRDSPSSHC